MALLRIALYDVARATRPQSRRLRRQSATCRAGQFMADNQETRRCFTTRLTNCIDHSSVQQTLLRSTPATRSQKCLPRISTRPCSSPRRVVTRIVAKNDAKPRESGSPRGMRHRERGCKRSASQFNLVNLEESARFVTLPYPLRDSVTGACRDDLWPEVGPRELVALRRRRRQRWLWLAPTLGLLVMCLE